MKRWNDLIRANIPILAFLGFLGVFCTFVYCELQMPKDFRAGIYPKVMEIAVTSREGLKDHQARLDEMVRKVNFLLEILEQEAKK